MGFGGFQRSTFEPHPEGPAVLTFVDWKDEPDGQYGPQIRLNFDSEEVMEDGRAFRVAFWITSKFHPKSNSYKFLKAMGEPVDEISDEDLEKIDLDEYIGRKCQGVIVHSKKADGTVNAKVDNLLPLRKRATATRNEPQQEEKVPAGAAAGGKGKWNEED